jgi:toxin YoeB
MIYVIELSDAALEGIKRFKKNGDISILKKINHLIAELEEHPETGTGKPEQLKGNLAGKWSRRITDKHRMVYEIFEEKVKVVILHTHSHYGDK